MNKLVSVTDEGVERCDLSIPPGNYSRIYYQKQRRGRGRQKTRLGIMFSLKFRSQVFVRLNKVTKAQRQMTAPLCPIGAVWCNHYFFCSFLFWNPCVIQWPMLLSPVWTVVHPLSLSPLSSPHRCHLCSARRRNFDVKVGSITTSPTTSVVCESVGVLGCLQSCVGVKYDLLRAVMFVH